MFGQLGLNSKASIGHGPGQMGDHLPFVDLGKRRFARAITSGTFHTCALVNQGGVICWGRASEGALGTGAAYDIGGRPKLKGWGRLCGFSATGQMGGGLRAVKLGSGHLARAISAGSSHTCAILQSGAVKCR